MTEYNTTLHPVTMLILNFTVTSAATIMSQTGNPNAVSASSLLTFKIVLPCIYMCLGLTMVAVDGGLVLTILASKELRRRKELAYITALFIGDVVFGLGFIGSSIIRATVLVYNLPPATPFECMMKQVVGIFLLGQLLSSCMMFMISIDRLFCETNIFYYMEIGKWYRILGVGVCVAITFVTWIVAWIDVVTRPQQLANVSPECSPNVVLSDRFNQYYAFAQHVPVFSSVGVYVFVMLTYFYKRKQTVLGGLAKVQRKRQREHTKILGIMCITTVLFYTVPSIYVLPGTSMTATWPTLAAMAALYFSAISRGLCAVANALVFVSRPTDVREELIRFVGNMLRIPVQKNGRIAPSEVWTLTMHKTKNDNNVSHENTLRFGNSHTDT